MQISKLANRISRYYAEKIEPLIFRLRQRKRLNAFALGSPLQAPPVHLALADSCSVAKSCPRLVRRYTRYFGRFSRLSVPPGREVDGHGLLATLDLTRFPDFAAYQRQSRKDANFFHRNAGKARKSGYYVEIFSPRNHTPDICAIRKSKLFRAFGPVIDVFTLTVDALGGPPERWQAPEQPVCSQHWEQFFGVFLDNPGYRQGTLVTNRQLVAYARLHRVGNALRYAEFLGHSTHMRLGVMMLLHQEVVAWLLQPANRLAEGTRYLTYGAMEQGREGLFFWKRKALFQPGLIITKHREALNSQPPAPTA